MNRVLARLENAGLRQGAVAQGGEAVNVGNAKSEVVDAASDALTAGMLEAASSVDKTRG